MARRNELGSLRRSQVITTHGPGAIVDFRAGGHGGAPVSVVVAGLEQWDERAPPAGLENPQRISEPRLQQRLGVDGFRLPPVAPEYAPGKAAGSMSLIGVRFPRWLQCPKCHKLRWKWRIEDGDPAPYCGQCSEEAKERIHVVPVRFIVACENGHLQEFPWHYWVDHKDNCENRPTGKTEKGSESTDELLLKGDEKAGLAGLILSCPKCKAARPMEGCFSEDALFNQGVRCRGERPWLASENEANCTAKPRALQRGASNLYFPITESALDIPPWSDRVQKRLGTYWSDIKGCPAGERLQLIKLLKLHDRLGMQPEKLLQDVNERIRILEDTSGTSLRWEEYLQLTKGSVDGGEDGDRIEFEVRAETVPAELSHWMDLIARVTRLREVRALKAFTRITPPASDAPGAGGQSSAISTREMRWLPAIEVRGEGVFVRLKADVLAAWEAHPIVAERASRMDAAYRQDWASRYGSDTPPPRIISPRFPLIHSLAHTLMRQLSLECGYSTASLRERLYIGTGDRPMAGFLIYTATTDSDGTLGGLARQGRSARMAELMEGALKSMQWCSSDPLCARGISSLSEALNLAACHSCLLAPETSCEEFNRLLDRATLVGLPDDPTVGYFNGCSLLGSGP